jgi:hypothetical protein
MVAKRQQPRDKYAAERNDVDEGMNLASQSNPPIS